MCPYCLKDGFSTHAWTNSWGSGNARCNHCGREFIVARNPDPNGPALIGLPVEHGFTPPVALKNAGHTSRRESC